MKLTKEQKQALPKKRANRREIDAFYGMAAALSMLLEAAGDKELEEPGILTERAKLIPGGLRDMRCAAALMKDLVPTMLHTFEPDKQRSIGKQMKHIRIKTTFAPEAHKEPEMFMLPISDLALLIRAATESCKVRMCSPGECSQCVLGKVIDRASFVSRGNRAWWEVFEQATRRDIGMEE